MKIALLTAKIKLQIWLITMVFMCTHGFVAYAQLEPEVSQVSNSNTATQPPERDPEIESELEAVLGMGFVPNDREVFASLLDRINDTTPIETYVRAQGYQILSLTITDDDLPQALEVAEQLVLRALESGNANAIAEAYIVFAEAQLQKDKVDAVRDLLPEIQKYLPSVTNPRVQYHGNNLIARALTRFGEFALALEHMLEAHAIISNTNDANTQRRRQFLNIHIARLQANLGNYSATIATADTTIEESLRYGLTERLPEIYLVRAYAQQYLNGPSPEIVEAFLEAAKSGAAVGDGRVEMLGYNNAGAAELLQGNLNEASQYLQQGIEVATRIGNVNERSVTEFNLGYIKVLQGEHQQGIEEMLAAAEVFKSFALPREVSILLSHIADAYEIAGMYQEQAAVLKEQNEMQTTLFETERDRVLSELQVRYQADEKSLQIQILEQDAQLREQRLRGQQRNQQYSIAIAILLFIIILLTAYAYRKSRKVNFLLNKANAELNEQSLRDPLTGLYNRRAAQKKFLDERRVFQGEHGLLLVDIDHFKSVNDTYGHNVGDEILVQVGERLRNATRTNDMVMRWGGEEFLLILESIDENELANLAMKILNHVCQKQYQTSKGNISISLSGGATPISSSEINVIENWEEKLKLADEMLYLSKEKGRNQIHIQKNSDTSPQAITTS